MAIHTCLVTYIYLVTYICPTKFSDVGFCLTKFKLCPTKIKSDRTNVLSSQIFICSPEYCSGKMIYNLACDFRHFGKLIVRRPFRSFPTNTYIFERPAEEVGNIRMIEHLILIETSQKASNS